MKISSFPRASVLVGERQRLITQRDGRRFGVTIGGTYQDDAMVDAVTPIVVAELDRRIVAIDAELAGLGVVTDTIN